MNALLAVLWKDLVSEWRSRDRLVAMGVFALLVVIVLYLAAPPGAGPETRAHVPGLLWVAYLFAGVLGLNRAFATELENEALSLLALAPVERGWIFLGKALASLLLLLVVQAATAVAFALAFDLDLWPVAGRLALVAALGAAGLCSVGTLFSAIAVRTQYREVMLPLLLLPAAGPGAARRGARHERPAARGHAALARATAAAGDGRRVRDRELPDLRGRAGRVRE